MNVHNSIPDHAVSLFSFKIIVKNNADFPHRLVKYTQVPFIRMGCIGTHVLRSTSYKDESRLWDSKNRSQATNSLLQRADKYIIDGGPTIKITVSHLKTVDKYEYIIDEDGQ